MPLWHTTCNISISMSDNLNRIFIVPLKETIAAIEKMHILDALEVTDWIQSKAARRLGISQRALSYKIKKYEITIKHKRGGERDEDFKEGC